ncbi:MAG: PHB depolymerase family esterase [Bacillales bacterium]|jgi:poly(hydroxyalkanoate) depolymerase family esterase|nr:PHB depolymerase family esterase [Bacillales bacterium]
MFLFKRRKLKVSFFSCLLSILAVVVLLVTPIKEAKAAGTFYSSTLNGRAYRYYVPGSYSSTKATPLFVMLHGATQTATTFAEATKMNTLAEQKGFIVLYPEQSMSANASLSWNWYYGTNQIRSGEAAIIASHINKIKADYNIDSNKVFVAGLSAGGAMAVIMAVVYPDLIKGLAVAAGLEFNAAMSLYAATVAMLYGGPSATTQGYIAYLNMPLAYEHMVKTLVFHGTADLVVNPINGSQIITSIAKMNDYLDDGRSNNSINDVYDESYAGKVTGGRNYTRYVYYGLPNQILMEKYSVTGMSHAWSGGKSGASYSDSTGPDMSSIMYNFFI